MLKWGDFSESQKDKFYSEHCSHELNLFLMTKDPDYFSKVVKPFIASKLEKTPVDLYLLGKHNLLARYLTPESKLRLINE